MGLWIIVTVIAVIIAIVSCRRSIRHGTRPSIWCAILGAFAASATIVPVMALIGDGREVFTRDYWVGGKVSALTMLPIIIGYGAMFSLLPTSVVVFLYQRKMKR